MKKKFFMYYCAVCMSVCLCGCSDIPAMTDEQSGMITEYAANLLIKHSNLPGRKLLNEDQLVIAEEEEALQREKEQKRQEAVQKYLDDQQKEQNEEKENESEKEVKQEYISDLASFIEEEGYEISCLGMQLCKTYPEESGDEYYFAMEATSGKQLCVLQFQVVNQTAEDLTLNMFDKHIRFYLRMNGTDNISAQTTLLEDDLSSYQGVVMSGESKNMVLVFEIAEGIGADGQFDLMIQYGAERGIIPVVSQIYDAGSV